MADISKEMAVQLAREAGFMKFLKPEGRPEIICVPDSIERFAKSLIKLGRNAGLESAKDKVRIHTFGQPLALAEKLTSVIESLKGA